MSFRSPVEDIRNYCLCFSRRASALFHPPSPSLSTHTLHSSHPYEWYLFPNAIHTIVYTMPFFVGFDLLHIYTRLDLQFSLVLVLSFSFRNSLPIWLYKFSNASSPSIVYISKIVCVCVCVCVFV